VKNVTIYLSSLVILLGGCQSKEKEYVSHYGEDKIVSVLIDLYVAEAAIKDIDKVAKDSLIEHYTSQIETIHKIDMELIEKDIQEIQARPKRYKKIHQVVQDSIVLMEKEYNKKREKKISRDKKTNTIKESEEPKELSLPLKSTK